VRKAAAVVLLVTLTACAPASGKSQASAAASRFAAALSSRNGVAACAVLTDAARTSLETGSGQNCAQAILDVHSSAGAATAKVWGQEAQVKLGTDTLFLDETKRGWRVRAAGCRLQSPDQPYQCEVAA